jgi:succinoglycan biosynthesis transport protein ExoP
MNGNQFLKLAYQYKWLLLAVPALTLLVTFLLIKDLPSEYKSQARISTGLLDPSRQVAQNTTYYSAADLAIKTNQQFTNIMDMMMMPRNMSMLSYRLMLHDLQNTTKAFRTIDADKYSLDDSKRKLAIGMLQERIVTRQPLTPDDEKVSLYKLAAAMGYDQTTLKRKLSVYSAESSDLINIEFVSESSAQSVFVVNTLANDFIAQYSLDQLENKNRSILVLDSLLKRKEAVMLSKNQELKDYKIKNRILNLDKQSQIAYQQIVDLENKKGQALVELKALQSALSNINNQLNSTKQDKYLGAETIQDNQAIVILRGKLRLAENAYVDGGFKASEKRKVDSLQDLLNSQLARTSDNYVNDPLIAKQSLIQRRITVSVDLDRTKAGIRDIETELDRLNASFATMVPFDAGVQNFERNADVATREYLDLLNRYNQTNLDKNIGLRLQLEQEGMPTEPEPSKKAFYLALTLLASLVICFALLALLSFFDKKIYDGEQLEQLNVGHLLGELSAIDNRDREISEIWNSSVQSEIEFKSQLRSLRFDIIDQLSKDNNVLGVGQLKQGSNNSNLLALFYAISKLDKTILLIGDGNVANDVKRWGIDSSQHLNEVYKDLSSFSKQRVTFLDNTSFLENNDVEKLRETLNKLKSQFDLVIFQIAPLAGIAEVKETIAVTDKYVAFLNAGERIDDRERRRLQALNQSDKFLGWIVGGVK